MYEFENILAKHPVGSSEPTVEIIKSSFGEILRTEHSSGVVYYDQRGSVGKYYGYNGVSKEKCKQFDREFSELINTFNIESSTLLIDEITNVLSNFRAAVYDVNYYKSRPVTRSVEYNHNSKYKFYCAVWPYYIKSQGGEMSKRAFKLDFIERLKKSNWVPTKLLDFMSRNYYDAYDYHIICSQHQSYLNRSRVSFYEREIKKGNRPPILVYQSLHNFYDSTGSFLVDGHHKLKAYENLSINPSVIEVVEYCEDQSEDNINELIYKLRVAEKSLFTEQLIDLIKQNYKYESTILDRICKDDKLFSICRSGYRKETYPNGSLKFEGKIINFKREGVCIDYYPDGTIKSKTMYKNGNEEYSILKYYHNGQLLLRGDENGVQEKYSIDGEKLLF